MEYQMPGYPPAGIEQRRSFLKYLLGGSFIAWLVAVLYPVFAYLKPPKVGEIEVSTIKVGKVNDFSPNSGKVVRFGNKPAIIIRKPDGNFVAFTAICTHLACTVQYRPDLGLIWCACHNGKYDLNGKNIAGPPPRPLEPYKVVLRGDDIYITREA